MVLAPPSKMKGRPPGTERVDHDWTNTETP
jgi:hypothetical protein